MFSFVRTKKGGEGGEEEGSCSEGELALAKPERARGRDVINFDGFLWSL